MYLKVLCYDTIRIHVPYKNPSNQRKFTLVSKWLNMVLTQTITWVFKILWPWDTRIKSTFNFYCNSFGTIVEVGCWYHASTFTQVQHMSQLSLYFITLHNSLAAFRGTMYHMSIIFLQSQGSPVMGQHSCCVILTFRQTTIKYQSFLIATSFFGNRPSYTAWLVLLGFHQVRGFIFQ